MVRQKANSLFQIALNYPQHETYTFGPDNRRQPDKLSESLVNICRTVNKTILNGTCCDLERLGDED